MDVKRDLATLYTMLPTPLKEYRDSSSFQHLEKEPDVIKTLQKFHLPEVTRLICASESLLKEPWANQYVAFKDYCLAPDKIDVQIELTQRANRLKDFEDTFLTLQYGPVIQVYKKYFNDIRKNNKEYQEEKKEIEKKKSKIEKKENSHKSEDENIESLPDCSIDDNISDENNELQEVEEKLNDIQSKINECDRFLKAFNKHEELVDKYRKQCDQKTMESIRTRAYKSLASVVTTEEELFLDELIKSGRVTDEMRNKIQSIAFLGRLLSVLEKPSYKNYAFPVLVKLNKDKVIDFENNKIYSFFKNQKELLCDYLMERYIESSENLRGDDTGSLFEVAVRIEIEGNGGQFSDVWNLFADEYGWKWLVGILLQQENIDLCDQFSKFLVDLSGKSAESLVKYWNSGDNDIKQIPMIETLSRLLKRTNPKNHDLILYSMRNLEMSRKKLQRKRNVLERKMNSEGQEVFSSLYSPIEQLEELAINLKCSEGNIRCDLVASQLMNMLVKLRNGLNSLGVNTVVDTDEWDSQRMISFNSELHRLAVPMRSAPDKVRAKTMGFVYLNDEGQEEKFQAKVYTKVRRNGPNTGNEHHKKSKRHVRKVGRSRDNHKKYLDEKRRKENNSRERLK